MKNAAESAIQDFHAPTRFHKGEILMKKKNGIILVIILLLAVTVCATLLVLLRVDTAKEYRIEASADVMVKDLVLDPHMNEVVNASQYIDTSTVGEHTAGAILKWLFIERIVDIPYTVIDTTAPEMASKTGFYLMCGQDIKTIENELEIADNSKTPVEITYSGEYDTDTPGAYDIKVAAKDESGNTSEKVYRLIVKVPGSGEVSYFETSKGFLGYTKDGMTYIDGLLIVNKTYGIKADAVADLTDEFKAAYNEMLEAIKADGMYLSIESGHRLHRFQVYLYNNSVNKYGKAVADTKTARPGNSEHEGGVAADFNWVSQQFRNSKEYKWLQENCYKYGFILRYPEGKYEETGYEYEPWHYRYVGVDLATYLYNGGNWITLEDYFGITSEYKD